jgi:squalene cyclase
MRLCIGRFFSLKTCWIKQAELRVSYPQNQKRRKKILQEIEEIKVGFGTLKKRYERKGLSREDYERAENYENELLLIETEIEEAKRMERLFEKMGREIVSKPAKY